MGSEDWPKVIGALECLVSLITRSLNGDESAIAQIKEIIVLNEANNHEHFSDILQRRVFKILYTYVTENYDLSKIKEWILRNNIAMYQIIGHGPFQVRLFAMLLMSTFKRNFEEVSDDDNDLVNVVMGPNTK